MSPLRPEDAYRLAWGAVRRLPPPLGYALFHTGADLAWALHHLAPGLGAVSGVGRLEDNLARLLPPGTPGRRVRRAGRAAMRSYMRYFYEAFALPGITTDQIAARVRADIDPRAHRDLSSGSIVLALPHMGNWDLVGAWACRELATVLTVAERLEPADLFDQFVAFRQALGMRVIGQARGERVFERLVQAAEQGRYAIALLADRDLSSSGVRAPIRGHAARVAAGPAALAQRLGLPLYAATIHYERLMGPRRRRAGSPWGLVLTVRRVPEPASAEPRERIAEHTRAWVRALEPLLVEHAVDWHMLQPVFEADLDPERLARAEEREPARGTGRIEGAP